MGLFALILTIVINQNKNNIDPSSVYNNPHHVSILLLNLSTLIRTASLILFRPLSGNNTYLIGINSQIRKIIIGAGSQIILLQNTAFIPSAGPLKTFFLIVAVAFLVIATLSLLLFASEAKFLDDLTNILAALSLVCLYLHQLSFCIAFIMAVILLSSLMMPVLSIAPKPSLSASFIPRALAPILVLERIFFNGLSKISYVFGRSYTYLINPIYSGFLFYYLPRILIIIPQIPLRLFHNGNIQRSLIFAIAIIVVYLYGWG